MTPEESAQVQAIAQSITDLSQTEGWRHYLKTVEALINAETPKNSQVNGVDDAIQIASKMAFVNGLKRAIQIPEAQAKRLNSLKEQSESSR